MANPSSRVLFDDDFLERLRRTVDVGTEIPTLSARHRPNRIAAIEPDGIRVETQRSTGRGSGPQLVPAAMILTAWEHLLAHGRLSNKELLRELKVHRSAFVCALLAKFPEVEIESSSPIVLGLRVGTVARDNVDVDVSTVAFDEVPLAAMEHERSEYERVGSVSVLQREAQLVSRFEKYLNSHGRTVKRFRITNGSDAAMYSDLADLDANILYEAKGSSARMSVRLAIGQVLDYGRYIEGLRLAVLLPEQPAIDLIELLEIYDVGCVVETSAGAFVDLTNLQRCP
jgi:hypothetical protein